MNRYLDALKKSVNTLTGNLQNLQNPPFDSFVGFVGTELSDSGKTQSANDTAQDAATVAHFRWRFHFTNKEPLTVSFSPMVNHAGALACYPDAIAAEPADRNQHRQSTGEDAALGDAVPRCEVEPVAPSLSLPGADDRRTCRLCSNLKGAVCSVAYPGGVVSAPKGYRPALDLVQRCAGFDKPTNDKRQTNKQTERMHDER